MKLSTIFAACLVAGSASSVFAQVQTLQLNTPKLDRWMYPFNFDNGQETYAACFAALLTPGFDDRDGQFLVGFDTTSAIPSGLDLNQYDIVSCTITSTVVNDMEVTYDDSWDSVTTSYADGDPQKTTDTDAGKPIELFGVGYRNGYSLATFHENSTFGGTPIVQPAEGARNAFPAIFDSNGVATDVSRQVRLRFEAMPWAIGTTTDVNPGDLIPAGTVLNFNIDLCDPTARAYIANAVQFGQLNFMITSLIPATGGPGGGTGPREYPQFACKEGYPDFASTITLVVRVGPQADFNGDGFVDFFDFNDFVTAFENGDPSADFNHDCFLDFFDFNDFVTAFENG